VTIRSKAAVALGVALAAATASPAHGAGEDPFFPDAGSDRYDVAHYEIGLRVDGPRAGGGDPRLHARVKLEATATRRVAAIDLDLDGLRVSRVGVNGATAQFRRRADKLTALPTEPLEAGEKFTVVVRYHGAPRPRTDPDGSREGWDSTADGAIVLAEPVGAPTWLVCNDRPSDKASFQIRISLPAHGAIASTGIANGRLVGVRRRAGRRIWTWSERQPMAPYLATVAIGHYRLFRSKVGSIPAWTAIHHSWLATPGAVRRRALRTKRMLPPILRFEQRFFGPYPFDATGLIIAGFTRFGYALETQTRPIFSYPPRAALVGLEVHELAHQWFGDSVSVRTWPNIWLNEGFATYAEWLWRERHGGPSALRTFRRLKRRPAGAGFWNPPPGRPGSPRNLFDSSVYLRGAMTLEALRLRIGSRPFFRVLRRWPTVYRYGNATTAQFVAFAEQESGARLGGLFQRWLYQRGKPV
jgi:aminopeptidase N